MAQEFLVCREKQTSYGKVYASVAWEENFSSVVHRLVGDDVKAYLGFKPQFELYQNSTPNAFVVPPFRVVLTTALLENIDSREEFAFVVAHELSHLLLKHHTGPALLGSQLPAGRLIEREIEADTLAARLMRQAGYETASAYKLLERLEMHVLAHGLSTENLYPSLAQRLTALRSSSRQESLPQLDH